jgi:hypothetical protein
LKQVDLTQATASALVKTSFGIGFLPNTQYQFFRFLFQTHIQLRFAVGGLINYNFTSIHIA